MHPSADPSAWQPELVHHWQLYAAEQEGQSLFTWQGHPAVLLYAGPEVHVPTVEQIPSLRHHSQVGDWVH